MCAPGQSLTCGSPTCADEPLHNRQLCSSMKVKFRGVKQGLSGLSAQGLLRLLQGLALLDGLTPDLWHAILFNLEGKGLQASLTTGTVFSCPSAEL